jgi:hypothetical protein
VESRDVRSTCALLLLYVSSYYNICVLIALYRCPVDYYICVLVLLYTHTHTPTYLMHRVHSTLGERKTGIQKQQIHTL